MLAKLDTWKASTASQAGAALAAKRWRGKPGLRRAS
jgi:hypothetical protein